MAQINLFGNINARKYISTIYRQLNATFKVFMRSLRLINTIVRHVATVNGLVGCTEAGKTQRCFFPAATRVPFTEVG